MTSRPASSLPAAARAGAQSDRYGTVTDLGFGGADASANAINASGVIVGSGGETVGEATQTHALIDTNGTVTDLNTLIPAGSGVILAAATGINDHGAIAGIAVNSGGQEFGFELIPVS